MLKIRNFNYFWNCCLLQNTMNQDKVKDAEFMAICYLTLREKCPYLEFFWSVFPSFEKTPNADTFHAVWLKSVMPKFVSRSSLIKNFLHKFFQTQIREIIWDFFICLCVILILWFNRYYSRTAEHRYDMANYCKLRS